MLLQNLCHVCSQSSKKQARECLLWFAGRAQKWHSVSHKSCNRWWELVLWLWPWVKAAVNQWKSPNSPRKKKWQVRSSVQTMLISFFDVDRIVHREFIPPGKTENQQFYECVERTAWQPPMKMPRKVAGWGLVLAPWQCSAHTAFSIQQFLPKNKMVVVYQPLTCPTFSLQFFFYPWMKQDLKGRHFADAAEVQ